MNRRDLTFTMLGAIVALAAAGCGGASPATSPGPQPAIASRDRVVDFCAACHAFPPPDSFPKSSWDGEVRRGFDFYRKSDMKLSPPSIASVVAFYEREAPAAYPIIPRTKSGTSCPVAFERRDVAGPHPDAPTSIAYVGLANLTDPKRPDVLACDMARGELLIRRAAEPDGPDGDWVKLRVEPVRPLPRPVTLAEIKAEPALAKMELIRQSRLSVAPVRAEEWELILKMAGE